MQGIPEDHSKAINEGSCNPPVDPDEEVCATSSLSVTCAFYVMLMSYISFELLLLADVLKRVGLNNAFTGYLDLSTILNLS